MGVKKTADFLEKATWYLAISLLVLSLLSNFSIPRTEDQIDSAIKPQLDETIIESQPIAPMVIPNTEPTEQE